MKKLNKYILFFFFILLLLFSLAYTIPTRDLQKERIFLISGRAQGTTYQIKYIHSDSAVTLHEIDSIFTSINNSLSLYDSTSIISRFNLSKRGVRIDDHLRNLVLMAFDMHAISNGLFDITCKPLSDLWGFGSKNVRTIPNDPQIRHVLKDVGIHKIILSKDSLIKLSANPQIDCNGIAQGYTVDVIFEYIQKKGIQDFIVELGGEIRASGKNEKGSPWIIGIENPTNQFDQEFLLEKKIMISNLAVTTSGSYRNYKKLGKVYFSHVINPQTGRPLNNDIISVTVFAQRAIEADALDNVFMLLGIRQSFELLQKLPNTGVYMLFRDTNGVIKDTSNVFFKQHLL